MFLHLEGIEHETTLVAIVSQRLWLQYQISPQENKCVAYALSRKVYLSQIFVQKEIQVEFEKKKIKWVPKALTRLEMQTTLLEKV